ncbi:MAG: MucB/RseB C-terminal domain-containing protein [Methylophilaceae bacterium]
MCKLLSIVRFVFALLLTSTGFNVYADDASDWQILQKAAVAAHALSYQGVFICQSGSQTKSVEIKHLNDGQKEFARNIMLDGAPREVLSQDGEMIIYNPKQEKIIIEKRRGRNMFPAVLPTNIASIKENYTLHAGGIERVAGRQVQLLSLNPKDQYRNSHQLWIDSEYGLILKSVTLNKQNIAIDNIAFNQLSLFDTLDLDWFQPNIHANKKYVMEDSPPIDVNASPHWQLKALPAGFRKIDQMALNVQGRTIPVTQLLFSDGLASVSVFIEPVIEHQKPRLGASMVGNTSVYSRVAGFLQITALGEVPEITTKQIANAVIFVN